MNDDELRDMIRESIARHLGSPAQEDSSPDSSDHASHLQFPLQRGGDVDGACLIEPSVRCTHCGYCLSYGH